MATHAGVRLTNVLLKSYLSTRFLVVCVDTWKRVSPANPSVID